PLSTLRLPTATPRFVNAMLSRALAVYAAAARSDLPAVCWDELPEVEPWFGVMSVSFGIQRMRLMSWLSSSAAIVRKPVAEAWPSSARRSFTEIVLSGWITNHEFGDVGSNGPYEANWFGSTVAPGSAFGSIVAAAALPAMPPAPTAETITTPPQRN